MYYVRIPMIANDEVIAKAVQNGDTEAFGELVLRYELKLKRYARKFLNYQEDIEDLVQDVFIKAYTNIQSFDVTLRFSPWIYRIAHNTFVNELKRKSHFGFRLFEADTILPFLHAKETADSASVTSELQSEIETLLARLDTKYREVVVLHYLEELSYDEISEVLQIPISTVGVRLLRARRMLQEYAVKQNL